MENDRISEVDRLKKEIQEVEEEIRETKRRLPAHSVKPPVMMDLLDLEDKLDLLLEELRVKS